MKAVYFDFWGMGGSRFSDAKDCRNFRLSGPKTWGKVVAIWKGLIGVSRGFMVLSGQ